MRPFHPSFPSFRSQGSAPCLLCNCPSPSSVRNKLHFSGHKDMRRQRAVSYNSRIAPGATPARLDQVRVAARVAPLQDQADLSTIQLRWRSRDRRAADSSRTLRLKSLARSAILAAVSRRISRGVFRLLSAGPRRHLVAVAAEPWLQSLQAPQWLIVEPEAVSAGASPRCAWRISWYKRGRCHADSPVSGVFRAPPAPQHGLTHVS